MAIGALYNQLSNKMAGPEKATILLFQYEGGTKSSKGISKTETTGAVKIEKSVPVGGGGAKSAGASGPSAVPTASASASLKAASQLKVSVPTPSIPSMSSGDNISSVAEGPSGKDAGLSYTSKMYTVAFNPESLEIGAEGGGLREQKNWGSSESGKSPTGATEEISYVSNERRNMTMSVDLYFDRVNPGNAFTEIDPTKLAITTGTIDRLAGRYGDYSVQEEVEGFLAAIQSNMTNIIRFVWGDMVYTGTFNEITAEYTMFNTKGYPVRAKVYLRLTLIDTQLGWNYMGDFQDSFEEVFKYGNTSWSSLNLI